MRAWLASCAFVLALGALGGAVAAASENSTPPGASGDWNGLRTDLKNDGIEPSIKAYFQGAYNPVGGSDQTATGAGELDIGASFDLGKLVGDNGGTLKVTITDRYGASLGAHSGIDALMETQDLYGRGDIWRLSELGLDQKFFGKTLDVKGGRIDPGSDFGHFACDFQNLTFCGAQAGNLVGDYWYNAPVSQWGGRISLDLPAALYAEAGAYQVNPVNLDDGFTFDTAHATGALLPVELGWKPKQGFKSLPGEYKLGAWYSTVHAPDVYEDANGAPKAVTGLAALDHRGRTGFYVSLKQQVTGSAGSSPSGLTLFLNFVAADRRTSMLDEQLALGGDYRGLIPARPEDGIALAFGYTHVNDRYADTEQLEDLTNPDFTPIQHTEYVTELDYRASFDQGNIKVTPNLQWIVHPGGVTAAEDAVVLGLNASVTL